MKAFTINQIYIYPNMYIVFLSARIVTRCVEDAIQQTLLDQLQHFSLQTNWRQVSLTFKFQLEIVCFKPVTNTLIFPRKTERHLITRKNKRAKLRCQSLQHIEPNAGGFEIWPRGRCKAHLTVLVFCSGLFGLTSCVTPSCGYQSMCTLESFYWDSVRLDNYSDTKTEDSD